MGIVQFIQINVEYNEMIAQAKRLEDAADECSEAASRISAKTADMLEHWKGETAEATFLKLVEMLKETNFIQQELREAAAKLRRQAEQFKAVDSAFGK